jgi:phytoene dehydrogenase-like protein
MAKKYDAIIIGAGIGGLATALMLSHLGRRVLLLEQQKFVGGRCSSFDRQGFHYDLGVHLISRSDKGIIGDVLRRVGIPNPVKYVYVRPLSSYQGKVCTFPRDFKDMVSEKDYNGLLSFLGDIRFMPEEKMAEYDHITLKTFLSQYTLEPLVHGWVNTVTGIYIGCFMETASTGEFMRCLKWEAEARASGYPYGGCNVIADAYADGIRQFGGDIELGAKVQKIEVERGHVKGVMVGDNLYQSDVIVSNADIQNTILNLVGVNYFPSEYVEHVKGLKYTRGGVVVRIALNRKLTDIHMLGSISGFDSEEQALKISKGIIPEEIDLMVVVPSNFSDKSAPEGKQYVCLGAGGWGMVPKENKQELIEAVINTAEHIIPGLRENILWVNAMASDDLNKMLGEHGAFIGVQQTVDQVGDMRPKINTPIEGLYIVGCEAGGHGVGIELAASSAVEFMDSHCPI